MRAGRSVSILALVLAAPIAVAQGQPAVAVSTSVLQAASAGTAALTHPPAVDLATRAQVDAVRGSVAELSMAVQRLSERNRGIDFATLGGTLLVALVTALATFLGTRAISKSRERADFDLALGKSKLDVAKSLIDWKLRQLAELYGPLRTLFAQSNAIYRVMNTVLQTAAPDKFKLLTPDDLSKMEFERFRASADEDGFLFLFASSAGGEWERFRTVMFIDEVYGKGYDVELYFDQIVDISRRIVAVIETKAGLALSETGDDRGSEAERSSSDVQDTLRHKFGQYLAHAAVLQAIHANRRAVFRKLIGESDEKAPVAPNLATHVSAAFPQQIQVLIGTAHNELQGDVAVWAQRAR